MKLLGFKTFSLLLICAMAILFSGCLGEEEEEDLSSPDTDSAVGTWVKHDGGGYIKISASEARFCQASSGNEFVGTYDRSSNSIEVDFDDRQGAFFTIEVNGDQMTLIQEFSDGHETETQYFSTDDYPCEEGGSVGTDFTLLFSLRKSGTCTSICNSDYPMADQLRLKVYKSKLQLGSGCHGECIESGALVYDEYIFDTYSEEDGFGDATSGGGCDVSGSYLELYLDAEIYRYCWEVYLGDQIIDVGSVDNEDPGECTRQDINPPQYVANC